MERKILFICNTVKWFDKVNGNTYHSVRITRTSDGETIAHPWTYGYGDSYQQTALETMYKAGWLPKKYTDRDEKNRSNLCMYERENNYPILWNVSEGLKREMVRNGDITYKN